MTKYEKVKEELEENFLDEINMSMKRRKQEVKIIEERKNERFKKFKNSVSLFKRKWI